MDILMPQLGETVTEGTLASWSKAVGDRVVPGDVLFEIETDKTSMEIPATAAGVITEIRVAQGEIVAVGTVVAVIADESGATVAPAAAKPAPVAAPATKPASTPAPAPVSKPAKPLAASAAATTPVIKPAARVLDPLYAVVTPDKHYGPARLSNGTQVTPLARRLAGEAEVSLDQLKGSGPGGRIIGADIQARVSAAPARTLATTLATGASASSVIAQYAGMSFEEIPLDGMRKVIARRLLEAKQTIPHFYLSVDVQLDALNALRNATNAAVQSMSSGATANRLSVNDFVIKALGVALLRVPAANAVWAEDRMLRFHHADVSVAVAIDGGLITPVIRQADDKDLYTISTEMKRLAQRARERQLQPAEYQGGSITVSNLGMYGVREFSAIINPPQSAILAVGAGSRVPIETPEGGIRFISQMTATLSCDHRVIDGAVGAQLLAAFKALMEDPALLLA